MWDPGGSQLATKTSQDKANGYRGANDKAKAKPEKVIEKQIGKKCTRIMGGIIPGIALR